MSEVPSVDVFICGAGPVGLVLAYQLNRLNISTFIIDAADKSSPDFPMYGRACTLLPRTLEFMDQLDLFDDLAQIGRICRGSFTYRNGQHVHGRGWSSFDGNGNTFFEYALNVRLKFSEDVFRRKLAEMGQFVQAPLKMVDFSVDESASHEYKVSVHCQKTNGESINVRAKYIVGADGGSSAVRKIADIPFIGNYKDQHWVRIDGMVTSNIPEERIGTGAIESPTHGQVLWVALDNNATRIGYVLSKELYQKYGKHMTQEQAVYEAKLACAPFEVEFEHVDWHTVYGIQQHVAERLVDRDRVILAGDAAHTHSSGTAQGMNTGMHDVVSLYWRLAGVIKGFYSKNVLQNYSDERRAIAQQLINNDVTVSMLISGEKPESMQHRPDDTMVLLQEFLTQVKGFGNGLGISYPPNLLNDTDSSSAHIKFRPGARAVDAMVYKPGFRQIPVRLYELTRYNGKFRVLVFAGYPHLTSAILKSLRAQFDKHKQRYAHAVDFLTIIEGSGQAVDETLGVQRFGKAVWDTQSNAHWTYGVPENLGALVVLRPDGMIGQSAPLDGLENYVLPYFNRMIVAREPEKQSSLNGISADIGELINPNENNLAFSRKNAAMPQLS